MFHLICSVTTDSGVVMVKMKSAHSCPYRAHDLTPQLETVMSPKDSAFTGVWIFHFLGQSFESLSENLVKLGKKKNYTLGFHFVDYRELLERVT